MGKGQFGVRCYSIIKSKLLLVLCLFLFWYAPNFEGKEGVDWELGFAYLLSGKLDWISWDWDLGMKR